MIEPKNIEPCFNCGIIDRYCQKKITEELEKIKAEVCEPNEMEYFENSNVWQKWFCNLIDKHISELKGE